LAGSLRLNRAHIALAHDIVVSALAFLIGIYARWGSDAFDAVPEMTVFGTVLFTIVCAAVFSSMGLYRGIWRYASLNDIIGIVRAATLAVLLTTLILFLVTRGADLPRASLIIAWIALILLLSGPRLIYRVFKDGHFGNLLVRQAAVSTIPVLLVGAGDEADLFIREMARRVGSYRAVGIIDEKGRRIGQSIRGITVMGEIETIPDIVRKLGRQGRAPQRMIATRHLDPTQIERLLELSDALALPLARLPRLTDFREEDGRPIEIRPIDIEDLLNRPQTALDRGSVEALVRGRRVLVTGAGGTIGAELVRQLTTLDPAQLILIDHSEYALYLIDLELSEMGATTPRTVILGNIRDRRHLGEIFASTRPELVFHAAALKHVPMVEANPEEGILTNVIGTRNVADAAREHGAIAMVMISTDKAVNPSNVMGASKRLAETWCQTLDRTERRRLAATGSGTRYVTVRFGNVLGSTGSVVPLFQRQLARGGPLTVTHPDMTRYFMTVREAVELVLQASALGVSDAETGGKIFVLDMGDPVRILDLARQIIRLAGFSVDKDIHITFTGLRPGEKLSEQLFHDGEMLVQTATAGILLAAPRVADIAMLGRALDALEIAARARNRAEALAMLAELVPEYRAQAAQPVDP
jgi:O-antigen biosynthesis protein WbqV